METNGKAALLSRESFERAASFVRSNARPIDRAVFEAAFADGDWTAVPAEMELYRNPDGGFGNGLELDFLLPASSPMATSVAFQYLIEAGVPVTDPLVRGGLDYLLETLDIDTLSWEAVPPEIEDFPHAPWWVYKNWSARDLAHWTNPGAEIVGIFFHYAVYIPPDILSALAGKVGEVIRMVPDKPEMHDFLCLKRLAALSPASAQAVLMPELKRRVRACVALTSDQWTGYGLRPYQVVNGPRDPILEDLKAEFAASLAFEIGRQGEDGAWAPTWSWDNDFEAEWEDAKRQWKGVLTVKFLKLLRAFGRIEGIAPSSGTKPVFP